MLAAFRHEEVSIGGYLDRRVSIVANSIYDLGHFVSNFQVVSLGRRSVVIWPFRTLVLDFQIQCHSYLPSSRATTIRQDSHPRRNRLVPPACLVSFNTSATTSDCRHREDLKTITWNPMAVIVSPQYCLQIRALSDCGEGGSSAGFRYS